MRKRVLLADDHTIVLDGLRNLLEQEYEVVAEVRDGRALVEAADRLRPDVIIADIAMPVLNGLEALRKLRKADLRAKILIITMHASVEFAVEAIRLGASGYVLKDHASEELHTAIREALSGRLYITPEIEVEVTNALAEREVHSEYSGHPQSILTPRQREVLQLVAEGRRAKEIANILHISTRTAEHHKYNLMDKLKLRTTAELTQYALKRGIIQPLVGMIVLVANFLETIIRPILS